MFLQGALEDGALIFTTAGDACSTKGVKSGSSARAVIARLKASKATIAAIQRFRVCIDYSSRDVRGKRKTQAESDGPEISARRTTGCEAGSSA